MSADLDRLKSTFGSIAEVYDAVRPGYPNRVAELVMSKFPETQTISALEVGCGSGQATGLFANAGAQIIAIDISADLIALAQKRLAEHANVRFEVSAFETFNSDRTFDLVYSAQAFHWVPTEVGLPGAARLLKPGGSLALFWNFINYDANEELVQIRESIIRHIPLFARFPEGSTSAYTSFRAQWMNEIAQTDRFKHITAQVIETGCTYSLQDYLVLVSSYSWFQSQPENIRDQLVTELQDSFDAPLPPFPVQTLLIMAERNSYDLALP